MSIFIVSEAIDSSPLFKAMLLKETGAIVSFNGVVRNINNHKKVKSITYEIYDEMVLIQGNQIIAQAIINFGVQAIKIVHRRGVLQVGETAVWLGVSAMHRGDAYRANQWLMDQIKQSFPIWKKEKYADNTEEWVFCNHSTNHLAN